MISDGLKEELCTMTCTCDKEGTELIGIYHALYYHSRYMSEYEMSMWIKSARESINKLAESQDRLEKFWAEHTKQNVA